MEYVYPVSTEIIIQHFKQAAAHTKTYEQVFVLKSFYQLIIHGGIERPTYICCPATPDSLEFCFAKLHELVCGVCVLTVYRQSQCPRL